MAYMRRICEYHSRFRDPGFRAEEASGGKAQKTASRKDTLTNRSPFKEASKVGIFSQAQCGKGRPRACIICHCYDSMKGTSTITKREGTREVKEDRTRKERESHSGGTRSRGTATDQGIVSYILHLKIAVYAIFRGSYGNRSRRIRVCRKLASCHISTWPSRDS